jgi:hypothetical protein
LTPVSGLKIYSNVIKIAIDMRRLPFSASISLGRSKESDDEMSAETDVDAKHLTALFSARMVTRLLNHTYARRERVSETRNTGEWPK